MQFHDAVKAGALGEILKIASVTHYFVSVYLSFW